MDEAKVNAFIASLVPPTGTAELATYVRAAVRALGGRSDAALARTMGVAPSTLASWKSRGVVPQEYVTWFTSTLADKVADYNVDLPQVGITARAAVVELIVRTGSNPLRGEQSPPKVARILGGLLALGEFVATRSSVDLRAAESTSVSKLADILEAAMLHLSRSDGANVP